MDVSEGGKESQADVKEKVTAGDATPKAKKTRKRKEKQGKERKNKEAKKKQGHRAVRYG